MRINYWQTFYEEGFYHIYNRAIGNDLLFPQDNNCQFFLEKWQEYLGSYLDTYAYCLMGNHFHFVIKVKSIDTVLIKTIQSENTNAACHFLNRITTYNTFLEDQFKRFFSSYTLSFNKYYKRHGSLFQSRFKRIEISNHVKLLNTICYVHHNPIHHDISPFYEVWCYSSYKAFARSFLI